MVSPIGRASELAYDKFKTKLNACIVIKCSVRYSAIGIRVLDLLVPAMTHALCLLKLFFDHFMLLLRFEKG